MIRIITQTFLFVICVAWLGYVGCAHTTPTPTATDAGVTYEAACANLAAIGCADGVAPNCASVLQQTVVERMTTTSVACLTSSKSLDEARACGGVRCQ